MEDEEFWPPESCAWERAAADTLNARTAAKKAENFPGKCIINKLTRPPLWGTTQYAGIPS